MRTMIGGPTHLSEHGEALQQSGQSEQDYRGGGQVASSLGHWYALQTYPRHEKRVHENLRLRAIESFLPLYETLHRWRNGCWVRVELPLFPGYLFVNIDPRERFRVLSLPGAVSMVGSRSGPWPLPEAEIMRLRAGLQAGKFEPHPFLAVGQKVRIKSGPLADFTGFLVRHSAGLRVVLCVKLIQQAAAVEVNTEDVEPVGPAPSGFDA